LGEKEIGVDFENFNLKKVEKITQVLNSKVDTKELKKFCICSRNTTGHDDVIYIDENEHGD
jgi:hypothetical protein